MHSGTMRVAGVIGLIASLITILVFLTGYQNLRELLGLSPPTPTGSPVTGVAETRLTLRPGEWLASLECPGAGFGDPDCAPDRVVERAKALLGPSVSTASVHYDETPTLGPNGKEWTGLIAYNIPHGATTQAGMAPQGEFLGPFATLDELRAAEQILDKGPGIFLVTPYKVVRYLDLTGNELLAMSELRRDGGVVTSVDPGNRVNGFSIQTSDGREIVFDTTLSGISPPDERKQVVVYYRDLRYKGSGGVVDSREIVRIETTR